MFNAVWIVFNFPFREEIILLQFSVTDQPRIINVFRVRKYKTALHARKIPKHCQKNYLMRDYV